MESTQTTHTPDTAKPAEQTAAPATAAPVETSAAPSAVTEVNFEGADEATKLKAINAISGKNYKTLEEAFPAEKPTKEQKEAAAEQKRKSALSWAIENDKLTSEKIEKAVLAKNKNSREIAKEVFAAELREEDKDISDNDIEARFQDYAHEDKEDSDPLRKAALKRIEKVADAYRADATRDYDGVEAEYDKAQTSVARFDGYSTQVKAIAKELPKELQFAIPFKSSMDGSETSFDVIFPVNDKVLEAVRKDFLNEGTYRAIGAHENEVKADAIKGEMEAAVYSRVFKEAATSIAQQVAAQTEKHVRATLKNIPATGESRFVPQPAATGSKEVPVHSEFRKRMNQLHPATA